MFICIEGNIGSGKSTLAKALAKKLNAHYLPEEFEDNTLLPLFYNDKKKFAFPLEYSFLIDRHKQLTNYFKTVKKNTITVSDFHFDKCLCYAKVNLTSTDFNFYKKHFNVIKNSIQKPDLIIFLDANPDLLMVNIKKRGREIEKDFDKTYLINFKKALKQHYKTSKHHLLLPILIKEYTVNTVNEQCDLILEYISKHLPK